MLQFLPSKPEEHAQVQLFTPSMHAPLFRHGKGSQSSMSEKKEEQTYDIFTGPTDVTVQNNTQKTFLLTFE